MRDGKFYWDLKIEETKEFFSKRPSWMENYDNDFPSAAFIKGLISDYKPSNILEVGTAAGWAAYYMLDEAMKHNKRAKLTSVDFSDKLYYNPEKSVGCIFNEVPEAVTYKSNWELKNNTLMIDYAKDCRERFDFVFIDANHLHPWAALDFLACLPLLKKGAVVVFHDVFLNEICAGKRNAARHPDSTYKGVSMCKGPNILYELFKDEMTLAYDDVAPNCAALQLNDMEGALLKIYYALQVRWENEAFDDTMLSIISKHLDYIRTYVNDDCARHFSRIMFENYNALSAKNMINQKEKTEKLKKDMKLLNLIADGKKTVLWGASLYLEQALKLNLIDTKNILGVIDINPCKTGTQLCGLPVFAPKSAETLRPELIISTVVNVKGMQEKIKDTLSSENVKIECEIADLF